MATLNETTDAPDSTTTTYVVQLGDTFRGTLSANDKDVVRIALTAGTTYEFRLTGRGTGDRLDDPGLNLLDSNFALLYSNYRTSRDDLDALISYTPDTSGDYYLRLRGRDGESGDYELTVTEGVPASGPNFVSYDVLADQLTDGWFDWKGTSRGSFDVEPGGTLDVNITALTAAGQNLARWALEAWTNVTGINFRFTDAADAHITFDDDEAGAWARTTRTGNEILSAHVNVSTERLNGYAFDTYIHEVGHALGLGHAGNYDSGPSNAEPSSMFANDSYQSTIMSYFNQRENTHVDASFAYVTTPMIVDIIAAQNLYGAPSGIRSGDTVYGSNSNVGGYLGELFANLTGEKSNYPIFGTRPITLTIYDTGGTDTIDFHTDTRGQLVDLREEGISNVFGLRGNLVIARDTVIENYIAGSGNDTVTGNSAANRLEGRGGHDRLIGGEGADSLDGGEGTDRLIGGEGADILDGGAEWDVLDYETSSSGVTVNLATGTASGGDAEGDVFSNIEGIAGSGHDDNLTGDSQGNRLEGRAGDDTLAGGGGHDRLIGGEDADSLDGGADNDRLIGGEGADTLDGGAGRDVLDYETSSSGVTVNLATGTASGGDAEGDVFSNIEGIAGSGHDDNLTGDSQGNRLEGRAGDDTLAGGGGADTLDGGEDNDRLSGGEGADILDGGAGRDVLDYETSSSGVTVNLTTGTASGGDAEGDVFSNFERIAGSRHDDDLTGDSGENLLKGRAGDDRLVGGRGDDRLMGGVGNDRLSGDEGADTLDGGEGQDVLDYETSSSGVTLNLATGAASGGHAEGDVFSNFERIAGSRHDDDLTGDRMGNLLKGRAGDDRLVGGRGDDRLMGGVGDDRLVGGRDDDRLLGGAGADTLIGGSGEDVIDYRASPSGVTINLATGVVSGGHAEGDRIRGVEHVIGSEHDDHITGDAGANRLTGGGGDDTLLGGAGRDRFIFESRNGDDTIQDFTDGEDLIDLIGFNLTGLAELTMRSDDRGVVIDLSGHGGGTILLEGAAMATMDETDFLF